MINGIASAVQHALQTFAASGAVQASLRFADHLIFVKSLINLNK
jgi:hypothetical protein